MFQQNLNVNIQLDPVEAKAFSALTKKQADDAADVPSWLVPGLPRSAGLVQHGVPVSSTVSHTGWKNAEFDKLTQQADIETDPKKRDILVQPGRDPPQPGGAGHVYSL